MSFLAQEQFTGHHDSRAFFLFGKGLTQLHLKHGHAYYAQAQLQMYVYNSFMCDFVVWTSAVCVLVGVPRDDAFVLDMVPRLCAYTKLYQCSVK